MNSTTHTTMRRIIIPLLLVGAVSGMADAAVTGVRIHRLGDAPLPPRELDQRSAASYRRSPSSTNRVAKQIPPKPTTVPLAPGATSPSRLPLTPAGFHPAPKQVPTAPSVVVAPPPTPAPIPAPAVKPAPQPTVVIGRMAPAPQPAPVAKPTPAPVVKPVPTVVPQPTAAPTPAAPVKHRRRLPIAPVAVADGSTELPPVPVVLLAH